MWIDILHLFEILQNSWSVTVRGLSTYILAMKNMNAMHAYVGGIKEKVDNIFSEE